MKKVFLALILLPSLFGFSQADYPLSGEGVTAFYYNPASYGMWNTFSVNTGWRRQWIGVDGQPNSVFANAEFGGILEKMGGSGLIEVGGGISLRANDLWIERSYEFSVPLNVSYKISSKSTITLGVSPGFLRREVNYESLIWPDSIEVQNIEKTAFDMSTGLMWSGQSFYLGLAINHLTRPNFDGFFMVQQYYVHAGYKFKFGTHRIYPSAILKADRAGMTFQTMARFMFEKELFTVGLGYRLSSAVMFEASVKLWRVRLAYNFDLKLGPLNNYTTGSHELRLSYIFKKGIKLAQPTAPVNLD